MEDNIRKAMDEIKRNLEESFGAGLAARILFSARDISNAPIIGMTRDKYLELLKALYSDNRVKEMWGEFGAREKLSRWEKLAS